MPDLSSVLNETFPFVGLPAWESVRETFLKGTVPHCWAVKAPAEWHSGLLKLVPRFFLCDSGSGDDACGGCAGWNREDGKSLPSHPDMIVVGEFDKAGNIDACRSMIKELSLKPVVAARRLGVLLAADKLLVHAANSLLKIAEEPPSHVCLLFLMEGNDFLPTLRSRSRFTVLSAPLAFGASPMPAEESQWADWLNTFKENENPAEFLSSWTSHFLQTGDMAAAVKTDRLRMLIQQKKLSQSMVCDLLTLTLKEELPFEPIFSGLW